MSPYGPRLDIQARKHPFSGITCFDKPQDVVVPSGNQNALENGMDYWFGLLGEQGVEALRATTALPDSPDPLAMDIQAISDAVISLGEQVKDAKTLEHAMLLANVIHEMAVKLSVLEDAARTRCDEVTDMKIFWCYECHAWLPAHEGHKCQFGHELGKVQK